MKMFELIEIIDNDELINIANQLIDTLKEKTIKTIEVADDTDMDPLNEDDVKMILLSHATFLLGNPVDVQRNNDLEDLIRVNLLR